MSKRFHPLDDRLYDYMLDMSLREHPVLQKIRKDTAELKQGMMQVSPDQGQMLAFLVESIGASRALEVGVFTGYSALAVALAFPEEGQLIACEINEEWGNIAKAYWQEAKVASRIELRLGPALESLQGLIAAGEKESFDFAFIDADKPNNDKYYECAMHLVRPGGLIVIDNIFRGGKISDPEVSGNSLEASRAFNQKLSTDQRVKLVVVPMGDGMAIVKKS